MRKNKILKIFIAIILLISVETVAIAATTGIVNVETVRVREEATTDSDIVKLVSIGDKITITGEEGNWYKVKVGEVTGYIRKDLLTVDGETVEVPPIEEPDEDTPTQNEEPNTNEETPNTEEPNQQPTETSDETVGKHDTAISTMKVAVKPSVGQTVQLSEETKIKILPSANSSNIAKLPANAEVTVLEVINSWCRIESGEYLGWVRIDQ